MRILLRVAPVAAAFAPKCPICLLPLAAAFGVTLPSSRILTLATIAIVVAWVGFVIAHRQLVLSLGALAGAGAVLVGRNWNATPLVACGAAAMVVVALVLARRKRERCSCG